jgi:uncharacterized coiled-coil protein SlyX
VLARWRNFDVMPSLEERVAYLEGRFGEQGQITDGLRDDIAGVRGEMLRLFQHMDKRFEHMDKRFGHVDRRLDQADAKLDRHFTWIVGVQMASFLAIFGALLSGYLK